MMKMMRCALALASLASLFVQSRAQTITDAVVSIDTFNLLEAAVVQADLAGTLASDGPFTVFAPTNSSFEALGEELLTKLLLDPWKEHLTDILLYHVTNGNVSSSELSDGMSVPMLNSPGLVEIGIDDDGTVTVSDIFGDAATVISANVFLSNGVVHVIDMVLKPAFLGTTLYDLATFSFSTLASLVEGAGLESALTSPNATYTVFAPTDDAFSEVDLGAIAPEDVPGILLYHVLGVVVPSSQIPDGDSNATTLEGSPLFFFKNGTDVTINGVSAVVGADVLANNGIAHAIDTVLLPPLPPPAPTPAPTNITVDEPTPPPPSPSIVDAVVDMEAFSILESAVKAAGLVDALSGDGPLTVFAPTNASFGTVPADIIGKLFSPGYEEHLRNLLLYHVASGNVSSADLVDGMEIPMLNGEDATVGITNTSVTVEGVGVNLDMVDTFLSNGVVHVIDGVLQPKFLNETIGSVGIATGATTLVELLELSGLAASLNTPIGDFTLFVPSNEAFDDLDPSVLSALKNDTQELVKVLTYHVAQGVLPSSAIPANGKIVGTLAGPLLKLAVAKDENGTVTVNGDAMVTQADLLAFNGVVHVIDKVLIPPVPPVTDMPTPAPTMPPKAPTKEPASDDEPTAKPSAEPTKEAEPPISGASSFALATGLAAMLVPFVLL